MSLFRSFGNIRRVDRNFRKLDTNITNSRASRIGIVRMQRHDNESKSGWGKEYEVCRS